MQRDLQRALHRVRRNGWRADGASRALADRREREACALAQVLDINLGFDDPEAYVTAFSARMPDARHSMLLDHMAHRPSELNAINGQVLHLGRRHGISTPYNDTPVSVLRQREAAFQEPRI